jgi:hypothetical protein
MEITGIALALLDIPAEFTHEYNRWYDLDHLPEHISKGDVVTARRYVADPVLRSTKGTEASEALGGHPPYATIYFFGGPLDFTTDEAKSLWTEKDKIIRRAGRYWKDGRVPYHGYWRLADARARPSSLISREAIPHLPHRGVIVALGRAPSSERRDDAVRWWTETQLVDLFSVPGLLGALRFDPADEGADPDQILHVLLCEDRPIEVMERIQKARKYQTAVGRYPAHGGAYESIAFLPYEWIVPLQHEIQMD